MKRLTKSNGAGQGLLVSGSSSSSGRNIPLNVEGQELRGEIT